MRRALWYVVERLGSTRSSVERRLRTLGHQTVSDFRVKQLQWAGIGVVGGVVLAFSLVVRGVPVAVCLLVVAGSAVGGMLAADSRLTTQVRKRSEAYTRELPDAVELMALAVGSGESIRGAVERVARIHNGVFGDELLRMLDDVHAGKPLAAALDEMGKRSTNANVARFVDATVGAIEQGSGLAGALNAQARDSRDAARRALLEKGGRAEIAMMIPVVFFILPITVLFTIFPALGALSLM
ncbi:tight adherence protein C [Arcanobacterium wilhelmae]|uniref:Tight adherence protein C n=1 Tax=Arcanobacterium wilhelmae TaxID=1803177 RepID=A0ABT9NCS4_9ACTO|nr:type II secretion system F family protein [Arcanobacterium wilhelmae]MDP9801493.1 tight adherence protein C [Arcanobacterium wilhelmae]WFN90824.1 type II secretion system F family protein [Arcanobacterium wilhelmae]